MTKNIFDNQKAESLFEEGKRLATSGEYALALAIFDKVIGLNREHARAYFERGTCLYVLGRYRQAAEDIDTACLLGCEVAQIWSRYESVNTSDIIEDESLKKLTN